MLIIKSRYDAGYRDGYNANRGRFLCDLPEMRHKGRSYKLGFADGFEASSQDRLKEFAL